MDDDDVSCECQRMSVVLKPTCKLKIGALNMASRRRWYVSCDKHGDRWVGAGPDGYFGRRAWQEAFDHGADHQREWSAMW